MSDTIERVSTKIVASNSFRSLPCLFTCRLSGRLDFLLNQIKRNTDDADDPLANENVFVYEDKATDDEGSEVNFDCADSTDEDDVDMANGNGSTDEGESDDDMDES